MENLLDREKNQEKYHYLQKFQKICILHFNPMQTLDFISLNKHLVKQNTQKTKLKPIKRPKHNNGE